MGLYFFMWFLPCFSTGLFAVCSSLFAGALLFSSFEAYFSFDGLMAFFRMVLSDIRSSCAQTRQVP